MTRVDLSIAVVVSSGSATDILRIVISARRLSNLHVKESFGRTWTQGNEPKAFVSP